MTARPRQQREPEGPQMFLRIRHPTLDPREITHALAIEPIQTVACGSSVEGAVRRLHSESYWIAQLPASEDWPALAHGSDWDLRIVMLLKELVAGKPRAFLQQVIREGGSVTLLVERGEQRSPFVIKQALAKLAELGIELEVD